MKKKILFIFALIVIIPFSVFADDAKVVNVVSNSSGSTIEYNGTTEDGVYAVMCKLYDSENNEIDQLSSAVDNKTFEGSFTNLSDGIYNLSCARYEGGEVKRVEVIVGSVSGENSTVSDGTNVTSKNPKTYDSGIKSSIILFISSFLGIICSTLYLKNKK